MSNLHPTFSKIVDDFTVDQLREEAKREHALAEFTSIVKNYADFQVTLLISKHRDYGPKNISNSPGGALNGLRVRMHDKLARINNLLDAGADPQHESLRDSFIDLANYALIAQLVIDGEWPND